MVEKLIAAYNDFDYKRASELLNVAFSSLDQFSQQDQKQIYQYAAFIAFQNGNTALAKNHFWEILKIDPTYSPDPLTTPPKLQTLFQQTKISFLQDMNLRLQKAQLKESTTEIPWRGFVVPGWEQWHRGYHTKGLLFGGLASAGLAGTIYSVITTQQKKQDYREATDPAKIPSLYDRYKQQYQNQFYFGYALAATWLVSWIDLNFWSGQRVSLQIGSSPKSSAGLSSIIQVDVKF